MTGSKTIDARVFTGVLAGALALLLLPLSPAGAARNKNIVLYLPKTHGVLPLRTIHGSAYFPLLQLLNLVGSVTGLREGQDHLQIWYGNTQIVVRNKKKTVRLDNASMKLARPMRVVNGVWEAPGDFLSQVLPALTNQTVTYDPRSERAFIGNVNPNTFSVAESNVSGGVLLRLQFAEPVEIETASRDGRWIIYLKGHPVQPLESQYTFHKSLVKSLEFDDQDGSPKLIFIPERKDLNFYPKLSAGGRVLTAEVAEPGVSPTSASSAATVAAPTLASPETAARSMPGVAPVSPANSTSQLFVVVLDAGHGGADTGARGPNGVLEKNLTLQMVDRVQAALLGTQRFRIVLTRTGDADPDFNQRAATANAARPVCFISFHAGDLGATTPRALVFTNQLTAPATAPSAGELFVPWGLAQEPFTARSQQLAGDLSSQLQKITGVSTLPPQTAPVRALESIEAPAVALEVGSLDPNVSSAPLLAAGFQDAVARAVANGVELFAGTAQAAP